ncbi:MAG: c-type cytochrome [Chitinophagaceae bacterium]|nr:MAG: c-type cytochrome [Chitinophagaceae bacterium]
MLSKKMITLSALASMVVLGVAAVKVPAGKYRNLQVLPKDISDQKLDSIMDSYNKALGIGCNFCHSPAKQDANNLDFALDESPMKETARKMMRMTIEINKTNFYYDKAERPEYLKVVTCKTCHRGEPYPVDL